MEQVGVIVDSPMDPNQKLMTNQSEIYPDSERYRRLVGKLIYLTITRLDISFVVGVVGQHHRWIQQHRSCVVIGENCISS